MSKKDDLIAKYKEKLAEMGESIDEDLLVKVVNGLGPSIYLPDASKVSCSDQDELDRIKKNFLIKKLNLPDSAKLDEAIKEVCAKFDSSDRSKYRAVFYYLLAKKFGKTP